MALTRKKITVRGKNGKTFQRSVMVRAGEAVKRTAGKVAKFVGKHKGKIAGAAALIGGVALAARHGSQIAGAVKGAAHGLKAYSSLHGLAKGAGMELPKGTLRHMVGQGVAGGRWKGRAADNTRLGSARGAADRAGSAIRGAASSVATRAVSGVAGLHAAVSNRRARKAS